MLKRIIALLLVVLTLFSMIACMGEYHFGITPGSKNPGNGETPDDSQGGDDAPTLNDDPTDDFVVTLMADGAPYSPRMEMYAYWNNGSSIHKAKFDENGVARVDGLDGDYRVSLSEVPNEYTYDPNGSVATNDERSIVLNLYTLNHLAGSGTGLYDCYTFQKTGVYRATIDGPDDGIYFQYAPDGMGEYSIESWVDVTEDRVNPYIDIYYGSSQWKAYERTVDRSERAPCGSYTLNFIHTVKIAAENISAAGQAVYTFVIKAESKDEKYPITVTFAVKRNGDFELPETVRPGGGHGTGKVMAAPTYDFSHFNKADHEYGDSYHLAYPEYRFNDTDIYVFDEKTVRLWERADGGDDFYHIYDEEKYAATDGYGPILYANITTTTRFNRILDKPFATVEYDNQGNIINAALSANGVNYKHLIEGYTALAENGYYCIDACPCHDEEGEPELMVCPESCTACAADCRKCPEALVGFEGYQAYVNSDGMVPVTEDIQEFLLAYCNKEIFFYDGQGEFEKRTNYQAVGSSGWLFACAYYTE
ncbi:MAG: 4Fe-4S dicluster domain-containing protein [Clostridia bacterium]|nr:4Fe-4S dicluster domain-containing protein [Clostridia bacterium]